MVSSRQIEEAAFSRAEGKCECHRPDCGHDLPHGALLSLWEARFRHYISAEENGEAETNHCQVLCFACYKALTRLPT